VISSRSLHRTGRGRGWRPRCSRDPSLNSRPQCASVERTDEPRTEQAVRLRSRPAIADSATAGSQQIVDCAHENQLGG
jgi:hypothetical protein